MNTDSKIINFYVLMMLLVLSSCLGEVEEVKKKQGEMTITIPGMNFSITNSPSSIWLQNPLGRRFIDSILASKSYTIMDAGYAPGNLIFLTSSKLVLTNADPNNNFSNVASSISHYNGYEEYEVVCVSNGTNLNKDTLDFTINSDFSQEVFLLPWDSTKIKCNFQRKPSKELNAKLLLTYLVRYNY